MSAKGIMYQITRITNRLHESNVSAFLFMWRFGDTANLPDDQEWKEQIQRFAARNESNFDVSFSRKDLLITNNNGKIGAKAIFNDFWNGWLDGLEGGF